MKSCLTQTDGTHWQGIGKAAATLFAEQGASLFLTDLDGKKLNEVVKEFEAAGYKAACLPGDLLDDSFAAKLVDAAIAEYGKISCLINNAGRREADEEILFSVY